MERKKVKFSLLPLILFLALSAAFSLIAQAEEMPGVDPWADDALLNGNNEELADPLEPMNRAFFAFNDKLYFWVLKPVATGYSKVLPEDLRGSIRDFFYNLTAPVRIVNNLLQGKVKNSGIETARFVINSTLGVAGLGDPAKSEFGLLSKDEDLGQTLGVYGAGEGFYICWPIFGPSSLRDTVGLAGDTFLSPLSYLTASDAVAGVGAHAGQEVNDTSLTLGDYEQFKESAFDPYLAVRDAYRQYRRNKIKDANGAKDSIYSEQDHGNSGTGPSLAAKAGFDDIFFVQVGVYADHDRALLAQRKLASLADRSEVKEYDRGDYRFYGVRVPAGSGFMQAKRVEQRLYAAGYSGALVVKK